MTREEILAMSIVELNDLITHEVMGREGDWAKSIAAAWEVVEKMSEHIDINHPYAGFRITYDYRSVWASFSGTEVSAKNAPEAICKASLLAHIEEEER